MSSDTNNWKSSVTSYTPGWIEMFESEATQGDGEIVRLEGEMSAAVVVGKLFHSLPPPIRFLQQQIGNSSIAPHRSVDEHH